MSDYRERVKHHQIYRKILKDWYGEEHGRAEMLAYCPPAEKIGDLLDNIINKAMSEELGLLFKLKENWHELVGDQLAKVSNPVAVRDHIVEVEVSHPAWHMEMKGPIKKNIVKKIQAEYGAELCSDIRIVAAGRH
ncbi:MAG: DUF721 domain-containing protein [Victivallales bacterium]|nr:DUF721 domain-containing protein [Victivallales bacterium]